MAKQAKSKIANGEAKEHILGVAGNLFYQQGIRAIGVDTIVAQAGVAKTTLYDHFPSKDDLINAYLEEQDRVFWQNVEAILSEYRDEPKGQLLALFDSFETMIASPQSLGCPFISAVSEFPELNQPGHAISLSHKQKVRARLEELARQAGVAEAEQLADQLMLILDGAFAAKRTYRSENSPARQLKNTAKQLIELHLAGC
jgi:AcrR family transcriptional regulator